MRNTVHKRRNVRTHSQMGQWARCGKECIFIVPQQSQWLLGTRADVKEHNDPLSVLSSPLLCSPLLLYSTYITLSCFPFHSLSSAVILSSPYLLPWSLLNSFPLLCFPLLSSHCLTSHPQLSLTPITFCLSMAQHSTSWLSLNIDRKVNDNST